MSKLIVRRILVISSILAILLGIEIVSDDSLFINVPDDFDVVRLLIEKEEQQALLIETRDIYLEKQYEILEKEMDRLSEEYDRITAIEADALLKDQEKAAEDAVKYAYTLGNRDKLQDYDNLFNPNIKHTFEVNFTQEEWDGLINDMVTYNNQFGTYRSNNYRKVDVTYKTDSEEISIPDVGIRSKGNIYSRRLPIDNNGDLEPIHYVLKFNETFDTNEGTEAYDWLKKREVFDLEKLVFKWNKNGDSTYLSEAYSYQVFREAGVVAPNMALTRFVIKIDGVIEQESLYSVSEDIDEEFIRRSLQTIPTKEVGNLYKVVWPGTLEPIYSNDLYGIRDWRTNYRPTYGKETNEEANDFDDLIDFTHTLDSNNRTQLKAYLEANLDVDSWLRTLAVSIYLGNPDDYRGNANNYYLYFNQQRYLTYIPFDFDHSLGQGWDGSPVFINYSLDNDIYTWEGDGFSSNTSDIPLVDQILQFEEYRIQYENYLELFIENGIFSYDSFSELFDISYALYGDEFNMYNNKQYYIETKIEVVLEDIAYYRNKR